MADNPEFTSAVEKKTEEAIGKLIEEQDWEEEDKKRLHKEYMKVRVKVNYNNSGSYS